MTTKTLLTLGSLGATLTLGGDAGADVSRTQGAMCAPKYTSKDLVGVDERGMYNGATSGSALVTCMAPDRAEHAVLVVTQNTVSPPMNEKATVWSLTVYGRDLSAGVPFSCYPFLTQDANFSS